MSSGNGDRQVVRTRVAVRTRGASRLDGLAYREPSLAGTGGERAAVAFEAVAASLLREPVSHLDSAWEAQ